MIIKCFRNRNPSSSHRQDRPVGTSGGTAGTRYRTTVREAVPWIKWLIFEIFLQKFVVESVEYSIILSMEALLCDIDYEQGSQGKDD